MSKENPIQLPRQSEAVKVFNKVTLQYEDGIKWQATWCMHCHPKPIFDEKGIPQNQCVCDERTETSYDLRRKLGL